jgi:hypothetical protein
MEGSGLEFDSFIVKLENTNKIQQELLQYRERFYCCFYHPFLSDVIPSISVYTSYLWAGDWLSQNTCSDEFFFFPLIVIGGDHNALP